MAEFNVDGEVDLEKIEKCVDNVVSEVVDDDMVSVAAHVCLLLLSSPSSPPPAIIVPWP